MQSLLSPPEALPERPLYFERGALVLSGRPYLSWLLAGALLSLGSAALAVQTNQPIFLRTCLALAVGITIVPFAMKAGVQVLIDWGPVLDHVIDRDPEVIRAWHRGRLAKLRSLRRPELVGVVFVPWAIASFYYGGYFQGLSIIEGLVLATMISSAAFTAGIAIYYLVFLARTVWQIGQFPVRVDPHPFGIVRIGHGLLQCYLIAAVVWLVISSSGSWRATVELRPVLLIGVPSLFLMIGSFVFCQIPLHRQMTVYKQHQLYTLDKTIQALQVSNPEAIDDAAVRRLTYWQQERERVIALPEWPFGWKSLAGLSVSALTPLLPLTAKAAFPLAVAWLTNQP